MVWLRLPDEKRVGRENPISEDAAELQDTKGTDITVLHFHMPTFWHLQMRYWNSPKLVPAANKPYYTGKMLTLIVFPY